MSTAKWIFKNGKYRCTNCTNKAIYKYDIRNYRSGNCFVDEPVLTEICPNCGATMKMPALWYKK